MYPNESNWLPKRLLQVPSFCFVSGYVHKMLLEQQPFLCKGADIFSRLALKDWGKHTYALLTQESLVHGLTQHGHMRTGVCLSEQWTFYYMFSNLLEPNKLLSLCKYLYFFVKSLKIHCLLFNQFQVCGLQVVRCTFRTKIGKKWKRGRNNLNRTVNTVWDGVKIKSWIFKS